MPDFVNDAKIVPNRITWLALASLALLTFAGIAAALVYPRLHESSERVVHTLEVKRTGNEAIAHMLNAEVAQRTAMLIEDAANIRRYEDAKIAAVSTFQSLVLLTADNPSQRKAAEDLLQRVQERFEFSDRTMALALGGQKQAAIDLLATQKGIGMSAQIRAAMKEFLATEKVLLEKRQRSAHSFGDWLLGAIIAAIASTALLGIFIAKALRHLFDRLQSRTRELEGEIARRIETEAALRQSQKLEAVGQLTGGIAHDFNNLLTIILGNLDAVTRRIGAAAETDTAHKLASGIEAPVQTATRGARNAATLTRQLLAFSRRQPLSPAAVDVNKLVGSLSEMLRRTLGEEISLEAVLAGGLWQTFIDPSQLENAIVNLAVNARDAMPEGGKLTIETANTSLDENYVRQFGDLAPGQYVVLCVSDTGTGIPADLIDKVFEPFFTTKETGKGSGLGLAMVHGFVKQSKGHIRIYSEPGQGTTVKLYLPRLEHGEKITSPAPAVTAQEPQAPRARAKETILLVEDNSEVREYALSVLTDLGYKVVPAVDAQDALRILGEGRAFSLLFTDVVLPGGMTGRDLAERLQTSHPSLPVLFTTGYSRNAIVHHGRLDAGVRLLTKPYTMGDLALRVREAIDSAKS